MKIAAAAIQMAAEPGSIAANLGRVEHLLKQARDAGAELAVLPEMCLSGYGFLDDFGPLAEPRDGPTLRLMADRARAWGMTIALGFVESDGPDLYDAMALIQPDGCIDCYRKRNLVFWEPFRFRKGTEPLVVKTPFGRVGLSICADMIYRRVWDDYRDRIDLALIASAWPRFTCRLSGVRHWLFGHVGPLAGTIPEKVAADLGIPVVFANQCGETRTIVPYLGNLLRDSIRDDFAGSSRIADGRHSGRHQAGSGEEVLLGEITLHSKRGPKSWHFMSRSASEASSSGSEEAGSPSREAGPIAEPASAVGPRAA